MIFCSTTVEAVVTELSENALPNGSLTTCALMKLCIAFLISVSVILLRGFGTFKTSERAARDGINPLTKEKIQIPEKKVIKFKPGSDLK